MATVASKQEAPARGSREWWAGVMALYESRRDVVTVKQFAEEEDVPFHALKYRVYKKGKRTREKERRKQRAAGERWAKEGGDRVSLVPVQVVGEVAENRGLMGRDARLEVETSGGLRIRFNEGTDVGYVAELVAQFVTMGGASC
jgi:hypothetical protein